MDTLEKKVNGLVLQAAIELLMREIKENKVDLATIVDMAAANVEALGEERGKAATVEAVYNAVKGSNHANFKFVKSVDDKGFKDMMADQTPKELTFYVFKEGEADKQFDLWVYDAQQGDYVQILSGVSGGGTSIDTSDLWSKAELDIEEYAKKTDLPNMDEYTKTVDLNLGSFATKDDVAAMTVDEVVTMFNDIKAGTHTPVTGQGGETV